jgi:flagellar biosynthesis GTPase FlhF
MLKTVPLSKIKDNPWRNRKRNPLDENRVEAIGESIGTTEFWVGVYGRELKDGTVEIAFGHHRVAAAKAEGLKEIPVEIQPFTNGDMLIRMSRENLRGDLVGTLEVVEAAVKAIAAGDIQVPELDSKTRKDALRYAPSFIPGQEPSDRTGRSHPYTADVVARFLGGVYVVKPLKGRVEKRAQHSVHAALGVLELEERKVKGFSEKILQVNGAGPDGKYVGAKRVLEIVSEIKQNEVKAQERAEKSAEEIRLADEAKRKAQQETKEREAKEKKEHDELLRRQVEALAEENDKAAKRIQKEIKDKAVAAEAKAEADKAKLKALDATLEAKKEAAQEQRKVDEYLPIRKETDRIIHILERRDLEEDLKALSRRPLSLKDRERVWQAIDNLSAWLSSWAAAQFIRTPQLSKPKRRK